MKTLKTLNATQHLSAPIKIDDLYRFAEKRGHTVDCFQIHRQGLSIELDGRCYIALRPDLIGQQEKETAAHEIGHCETNSFYTENASRDVIRRAEYRANKWAFLHLLPPAWVRNCIKRGICAVYSIAEEADVSYEFAWKALSYYHDLGII